MADHSVSVSLYLVDVQLYTRTMQELMVLTEVASDVVIKNRRSRLPSTYLDLILAKRRFWGC